MRNKNKQKSDLIDFLPKGFTIDYGDDGDYEDVDEVDLVVRTQDEKSDDAYQKTTDKIVEISKDQLENQYKSKMKLQKTLSWFFIVFLGIQYGILVAFLFLKGFNENFGLSDTIILTYMTSVFVETLGAIIIMIKFAFDSKQETEILKILNSAISDYQVFNSSEHKKTK